MNNFITLVCFLSIINYSIQQTPLDYFNDDVGPQLFAPESNFTIASCPSAINGTSYLECSADGNVTAIDFGDAPPDWPPGGSLHAFIGAMLPHLHTIRCKGCELSGVLPTSLASMLSLKRLELDDNLIGGSLNPFEEAPSPSLTYVDLHRNRFNDVIPTQLFSLTKLTFLDLSQNMLSGPVPSEVGQLAAANVVELHGNRLFGDVPPQLASLTGQCRIFYPPSFKDLVLGNDFRCPLPNGVRDVCTSSADAYLDDPCFFEHAADDFGAVGHVVLRSLSTGSVLQRWTSADTPALAPIAAAADVAVHMELKRPTRSLTAAFFFNNSTSIGSLAIPNVRTDGVDLAMLNVDMSAPGAYSLRYALYADADYGGEPNTYQFSFSVAGPTTSPAPSTAAGTTTVGGEGDALVTTVAQTDEDSFFLYTDGGRALIFAFFAFAVFILAFCAVAFFWQQRRAKRERAVEAADEQVELSAYPQTAVPYQSQYQSQRALDVPGGTVVMPTLELSRQASDPALFGVGGTQQSFPTMTASSDGVAVAAAATAHIDATAMAVPQSHEMEMEIE